MLINFSNHPYDRWSEKQKEAAKPYGRAVDLAFPAVPGVADESQIKAIALDSVKKIVELIDDDPVSAVMVQGEFTLTYAVVSILLAKGIRVVSACSDRRVLEKEDEAGNIVKTVVFDFERFRDYRQIPGQGDI